MWGATPHIFEGFPEPPGPGRPQKRTQNIRPDCLQVPSLVHQGIRYPALHRELPHRFGSPQSTDRDANTNT